MMEAVVFVLLVCATPRSDECDTYHKYFETLEQCVEFEAAREGYLAVNYPDLTVIGKCNIINRKEGD